MAARGRGALVALAAAGAALAAACGGGAATPPVAGAPKTIQLTSPSFGAGATLPRALTCDGAGRAPRLRWSGVPAGARELVLTVEDPDAPGGTFVHWTVFGIRPSAHGLPAAGVREGENSSGGRGWTPPCPPRGDRPHRYVFVLYALRRPSGLHAGARPEAVRAALAAGALARGQLQATYARG